MKLLYEYHCEKNLFFIGTIFPENHAENVNYSFVIIFSMVFIYHLFHFSLLVHHIFSHFSEYIHCTGLLIDTFISPNSS